MTGLTALLVFAGIPIAFALVVWVLLSFKSWGRGTAVEANATGGPLLVFTGAALPDPTRLPRDHDKQYTTLAGGGASGRW